MSENNINDKQSDRSNATSVDTDRKDSNRRDKDRGENRGSRSSSGFGDRTRRPDSRRRDGGGFGGDRPRRPYGESSGGGYRSYDDRPRRDSGSNQEGGENSNTENHSNTSERTERRQYDRPYNDRRSGGGFGGDRPRRPRGYGGSFDRRSDGRRSNYVNASDITVRSSRPGGNYAPRVESDFKSTGENSGERPYYQRDDRRSSSGFGDRTRRPDSRRRDGGGFGGDRPRRPYGESSGGGYRSYDDRPRRDSGSNQEGGENSNTENHSNTSERTERRQYDRPYNDRRSGGGFGGDRPRRPRGYGGSFDRRSDGRRSDRDGGERGARRFDDRGERHRDVNNREHTGQTEFVDYSDIYSRDPARISHRLSYIGSWSRRSAEEIVLEGRVKINEEVVVDLARMVSYADEITVDGKKMNNSKQKIEVYAFNKPRECLTTFKDPEGRKTIFDILPERYKSLKTIGRLDFNSEGLLLLTNNGYYSRAMEMPSSEVRREYRVRLFGDGIDASTFDRLRDGIEIDGVRYGPVDVRIETQDHDLDSKNVWVIVSLHEGKNREIRKIMEHLGFEVSKLIRTSYGNYHLGKLPPGYIINVTHKLRTSNVKKYDTDSDTDLESENDEM